jgi:hypothetical protein
MRIIFIHGAESVGAAGTLTKCKRTEKQENSTAKYANHANVNPQPFRWHQRNGQSSWHNPVAAIRNMVGGRPQAVHKFSRSQTDLPQRGKGN